MEVILPIIIFFGLAFMLWAIMSANGIKFGKIKFKKLKHQSAEQKNEEKTKKENPEKPKFLAKIKPKVVEKISESKPQLSTIPTDDQHKSDKVQKITKADFEKNSIKLPATSNFADPKERELAFKPSASTSTKPMSPFPSVNFGSDIKSPSVFPIGKGGKLDDKDFDLDKFDFNPEDDDDEDDDDGFDDFFAGLSEIGEKKGLDGLKSKSTYSPSTFNGSYVKPENYNAFSSIGTGPTPFVSDAKDRYEQVFGKANFAPTNTFSSREIVVGSLIAKPRAKEHAKSNTRFM